MKKKYITPEFVLVDVECTSIVCTSDRLGDTDTITTGQGVAEGTEYRSTLWN